MAWNMSISVYSPLLHLVIPVAMFVLALFVSLLASVDVTVASLCNGEEQCSEVIYLSAIKSSVSALGTIFITPWVGGMSDRYGRKPFFMLLFTIFALPSCILALDTSRAAVYAFFLTGTIVSMLGEGSLFTLFYAYVADTIPDSHKATAFGLVTGILSLGFIFGTMVSKLLPLAYSFQFSVLCSLLAILYIYLVMPESVGSSHLSIDPESTLAESLVPERRKAMLTKSPSSVKDTLGAITNSRILSIVAAVAFLTSFAEQGMQGNLLYFLKAEFHWSKDEFSTVLFLSGVSLFLGQVLLLPAMAHSLDNKLILLMGLFFGGCHIVLYGFASDSWVVYLASSMSCFAGIVQPMIGSIVSRNGMPNEQGLLQGVVSGIKSLSSFIAPLVINPLTAKFLSDTPPFHCPGMGLIVAGSFEILAFGLALGMPSLSNNVILKEKNIVEDKRDCEDALPQLEDVGGLDILE